MHSSSSVIAAVTFAFMLIVGYPGEEWQYLEDCDEICPHRPDAICQLRCRQIIDGRGEDCLNMFFDANNNRIDCYF